MQLFTRLAFLAILVCLAIASIASGVAAQRHVTTTVTRLYTGADGQSHAEDKEVAWRPAKLRAELNESDSVKVTAAQFLRRARQAGQYQYSGAFRVLRGDKLLGHQIHAITYRGDDGNIRNAQKSAQGLV